MHACTFLVSLCCRSCQLCVVGHHTTTLLNTHTTTTTHELDDTKCLSTDYCVNPEKKKKKKKKNERTRRRRRRREQNDDGGRRTPLLSDAQTSPKEKKESFVDERFHGCLSSTDNPENQEKRSTTKKKEPGHVQKMRCYCGYE